jgi:glycosyltransferase involved in cell wall biosynthesis
VCDLLVFASTFEGFGLPIVEAQATGRPVVTSNIMSMPEVAGDAACLVDPFNVSSIREGVLKVINDSDYRNALVKAGFENVKRFQPEQIARQYAELYHELVKADNNV